MFQILHPTDGSAESEVAFVHALRLALQFSASLRVLHAESGLHHDEVELPGVRDALHRWGLLPAGSAMDQVASLGLQVRKVRLGKREPLAAIREEAEAIGADLLVLATHPRSGILWLLHGSVAEGAMRRWPALVIPAGGNGFVDAATGTTRLKRVLVPLDPKDDPQLPLEWTIRMLTHLGGAGEVRLLQVGPAETEGLVLPSLPGWSWSWEWRSGEVVAEILTDARTWGADLIVMGTRGHDSLGDSLWGSRTERVLHGAPCPLLTVPVQGR